jgi:hypothetical protein
MQDRKYNQQIETMIDLVEELLQEEGYETVKFSETQKYSTSGYDCLVLRDCEGKEFTIMFDESFTNINNKWVNTNMVKGAERL